MSSGKKIFLGMAILALSGLLLGASICYVATTAYLNNRVLDDMVKEGYVLTDNATATASDIVNGKTAYVDGQLVEGNIIVFDTSDATAKAEYIVKGKTAYVDGQLVVGTLPVYVGGEIMPSDLATSIEGGFYLAGNIVVKGSKNLKAANIKKGITIFNVVGEYVVESEGE